MIGLWLIGIFLDAAPRRDNFEGRRMRQRLRRLRRMRNVDASEIRRHYGGAAYRFGAIIESISGENSDATQGGCTMANTESASVTLVTERQSRNDLDGNRSDVVDNETVRQHSETVQSLILAVANKSVVDPLNDDTGKTTEPLETAF